MAGWLATKWRASRRAPTSQRCLRQLAGQLAPVGTGCGLGASGARAAPTLSMTNGRLGAKLLGLFGRPSKFGRPKLPKSSKVAAVAAAAKVASGKGKFGSSFRCNELACLLASWLARSLAILSVAFLASVDISVRLATTTTTTTMQTLQANTAADLDLDGLDGSARVARVAQSGDQASAPALLRNLHKNKNAGQRR